MSGEAISAGFIPLSDAAPLAVAREMGFAEEEGLALELVRAPSWSAIRDMLSFGRIDASHMLSPVPVASALGLGGAGATLAAVSVLSVNGATVTISTALERRLKDHGYDFDFRDARRAGRALSQVCGKVLRVGAPFAFSIHAELIRYWLLKIGPDMATRLELTTMPPPLLADALLAGEIDAFCVGEPWGSQAVESGAGALLLPGSAIWASAPDKVLAVRAEDADPANERLLKLIRALWRAGRWLCAPDTRLLAAEMLARAEYLDMPAEIIERGLAGRFLTSPEGRPRSMKGFVRFHEGAANFPWRSQAQWIGAQLAARAGLNRDDAMRAAGAAFRSDIYRAAMAGTEALLPGASLRAEGAVDTDLPVASASGRLFLKPDRFFDGLIFEPLVD